MSESTKPKYGSPGYKDHAYLCREVYTSFSECRLPAAHSGRHQMYPVTMTLYDELTAAGIETAAHCSDLYFPETPESTAILERPEFELQRKIATRFHCQEGAEWKDGSRASWEVPFNYSPYWEAKEKGASIVK